jgi:prolipoprotein diacylglyceryltransferase
VPFYTERITVREPVNNSMLKNKWLWAVVIVVIAGAIWYVKPWHSAPAEPTPTEQTDG